MAGRPPDSEGRLHVACRLRVRRISRAPDGPAAWHPEAGEVGRSAVDPNNVHTPRARPRRTTMRSARTGAPAIQVPRRRPTPSGECRPTTSVRTRAAVDLVRRSRVRSSTNRSTRCGSSVTTHTDWSSRSRSTRVSDSSHRASSSTKTRGDTSSGLTKARLHQRVFRSQVLLAYDGRCAICRIRHTELLDAAHIIADGKPNGEPVVPNGLSHLQDPPRRVRQLDPRASGPTCHCTFDRTFSRRSTAGC